MRTILFERHPRLSTEPVRPPAPAELTTIRRLLSIRIALGISGVPAPDAAGYLQLTRYSAGRVALADILPLLSVR
ncbi:hypothetical protein K3G63_21550 [Hymenobacter sp. HSC-4F20]|uniref:hypothetical protein n=1 Tax=Hymenobacter sp. HSC-4F20 TaxID=2864135 RepID=UPI001C72A9C4|nr:hypothetical protein [Hymenobacter sp. HSC-4F20]MBX0293044.1 hypothetical protein [Hymenobacter sp. HSC-4F20]